MKTKAFLALLALVLVMAPGVALADVGDVITTVYNTNAAGGNGFYNGTGNVDGSFATTTGDFGGGNTVVLSLRGANRHTGPITPTNNNDYGCSLASPSSPLGECNYEFAVATTGAYDIGAFSYLISVQDLTTSKSFTYDPIFPGNDNSYWKGGKTNVLVPLTTGMENSEFLGFSFLGLNWNPNDQVAVYMSATSGSHSAAAEIGFNTAVPEPGAITLLVAMLVPLGFLARRRKTL